MDLGTELGGRTALVTGANRGIGACFVDLLIEHGASRVYAGARDLSSLAEQRARHGERLVPIQLDMTRPADIEALVEAHDDVDLLVSNAGRDGSGSILAHDPDDVRELFEVHAIGPWLLASGLAPQIRERRGGMIFVQSAAALILSRRGPYYTASKASGTMLAAALRESLSSEGVRVSNVFPGFTDTDIIREEPIIKASPRDVAERSLLGWAAGEAFVFPDRFAELVHEQLVTNMQAVIDEPTRVATETIRRYAAGE